MLFDTHAHCQFPVYGTEIENVMKRNADKKVIVNLVGTDKTTSAAAVAMANKQKNYYASIGLHPGHLFSDHHDTHESINKIDEKEFDSKFYETLAADPKVIGVGECGLDLYRLSETVDKKTALAKQTEIFVQQTKLAQKFALPLVIHCRDAHQELIEILKTLPNPRGTIHCYTSDWRFASQYLELGFYLGFTGIITFPPQKKNPTAQENLWEVIRNMPLNKILVETDCPYLAPIPYRGKQGEPWMVEEVVKKIAELRNETPETITRATTENARRLFDRVK